MRDPLDVIVIGAGNAGLSALREVSKRTQHFVVINDEGAGEAVLDGVRTSIRAGFAVVVPPRRGGCGGRVSAFAGIKGEEASARDRRGPVAP